MKRSIRFGLLLSSAEEQALAKLADSAGGLSKAAMIRNLIRREARERGILPPATSESYRMRQQEMTSDER